MEMIKANIGEKSKGRYFEATADKKQAFFVPVVHQKRVKNETTGEYEDGDVVWYQARFYGADADWVNEATQNGDPLLIWGRTEHRTREVDGNEYKSIDVYVDAVSVNPRLREVIISRPVRTQQSDTAQHIAPAAPAPQQSPWDTVSQVRHEVASSQVAGPSM